MKKWIISAVVGTFIFGTPLTFADNLKIGVVDLNQLLTKSPLAISLTDALTKKFKPRQDEINTANKQLQDEIDQITYNSSSMSDQDKNKLQNKIIADKANVQILTATLQRDIAVQRDADINTFMAKLSTVLNKIAQDGKYDIIEQRSNMLVVNNNLDLTQQVLKQLS